MLVSMAGLRSLSTALLSLCAVVAPCSASEVLSNPYSSAESWLCRPGRQDLCSAGIRSTAVLPDGAASLQALVPESHPLVDCFYVYPTISEAATGNSGLLAGPGENRAVEQQFAMFASVCRPFAPMYRQVTLAGLRSLLRGTPIPIDPELAYADVAAAWKHYLKFDNQGRGVVLVGHSQGARMLMQLLQREIEGTPAQAMLVSALLPGFNIEVPAGKDVGGSFKQIPLCKAAAQTGCVVSYVTFRQTAPPPANTRFGRTKTPGMEVACVDPVALSGAATSSHLPVQTNLLGQQIAQTDWLEMAAKTPTPFVALPGLTSVKCVNEGGASYLAATLTASPSGKGVADIPGDIWVNGKALEDWGLHLVDVNLVAGNLLHIVRQQSAAFSAAQPVSARKP